MAEVLLFHHAQGQTAGFHAFADELRRAGHTVHTPDLFDGRTFGAHRRGSGVRRGGRLRRDHRARRARRGRAARRARLRRLLARRGAGAEARADAAGRARGTALLLLCAHRRSSGRRGRTACRCRSTGWTPTRSSSARATSTPPASIVESAEDAELFLYPGDQHYFADSSLPSYDASATTLLTQRVLDFLEQRD